MRKRIKRKKTNHTSFAKINLDAVFWDLPELRKKNRFKEYFDKIKTHRSSPEYKWFLSRFLEYGRARDTLTLFSLKEIEEMIDKLKLSEYTRKKWRRLLEVYGNKRK